MQPEQLVVKAKFWVKLTENNLSTTFDNIKLKMLEYLRQEGFAFQGPVSATFRYPTMRFQRIISTEFKKSLLDSLRGFDEVAQRNRQYFQDLKDVRGELPFAVTITLLPEIYQNNQGLSISVTSEPTAYYQISQLGQSDNLTQREYGMCLYSGEQFCENVGAALAALTLQAPSPIRRLITTKTAEFLKEFKFAIIAEKLESGLSKQEKGEDATDELVFVIENFMQKIVERAGGVPAELHKPERNLAKLHALGYLSNDARGVLEATINALYRKLKDRQHNRPQFEREDLFDARLCYKIIETILNHLVDKIAKHNIRNTFSNSSESGA